MELHFYPAGTDPLDLAVEQNREFGFNMLVWDGRDYHKMRLSTDDCWSFALYECRSVWPDSYGSEFAAHWRFAILPWEGPA